MAATTAKISIALGREELRRAKQLASQQRSSLSGVITDAVRRHVEAEARREAGESLLRTFDGEDRASPAEMQALVDKWSAPSRPRAGSPLRRRKSKRSR